MATAPKFMLRTVATDGTLEKFLPDFSTLDMTPVYCDAGTIQFSYPLKGVNFNLLRQDIEIAVTMNGVEIPELRSLIETVEGDDADDAEKGALWKFTARTAIGKLDDAIVYPANFVSGQVLTKPRQVTYASKNMGYILNDLFTKARSRGALSKYTWDFNSSRDSEGNAWTFLVDLTLEIGRTYLDLLKELAGNGWLEFRVDGRVIKVWDYNKMGIDRSIGPTPLHFRKGRDIKDSPRKIDSKGLKTYTLVGGGDNTVFEEIHASTSAIYGRRESFYSAGSAKYRKFLGGQISTLQLAGGQYLATVRDPQMEVSHGLHFETENNPRPFTNFNVGDWAFTDVGNGVERFRILQWVISVASDGSCGGSLVMNWMFNTQLSQVNNAVSRIQNGTTNAGTAPKNDGVAPAQVPGVIPTSSSYFVNNIPRSTLTIDWTEVTTNEDGSDISDLDYYQVQWKYTSDTNWRATLRVEAEANQTEVMVVNLDPGASIQCRARAVDYWGNKGDWSTTVPANLAGDTIAPLKPAAPTVTSQVGTLRVVWTGLDFNGGAMPADLAGVEVHVSTSDFTPSTATKKDVLPPGVLSTTLTQGMTYGTQYWVKLVAVDTTGNRSTPSDTTATTHVVLKQLVNIELGSGQVSLSNLAFSDVGNLIDDGSFELADMRAQRVLPANWTFATDQASNGTFSMKIVAATSSSNTFTLRTGILVRPGETFVGTWDYRMSAAVTGAMLLYARFRDAAGTQVGSSISLCRITDDASYNTWHMRNSDLEAIVPAGASTMDLLLFQSAMTGTVWIDALEVRQRVDTLLLANLAVTNAKIANLAVNNAKISDLAVGKLTTGSLVADITVSARIKTADVGPRVEMNSGGIGAWNLAGEQTVSIASATGDVKIKGQILSGLAGRRIEINPTSTYLPELRFFPTTGSNYGFMNAVDGASGTSVYMGINSGQFPGNGSVTSQYRLYLLDGTFGASLQTVESSGGASNGGYFRVDPTSASAGVVQSGRTYGFMETFHDSDVGDIGARIGHVGSSSTSDAWFTAHTNGFLEMIGKWDNTVQPWPNSGIVSGVDEFSTAISGFSWVYGPTMLTKLWPIVQVRDQGASAAGMTALTQTGFTVEYNVASTGVSGMHFTAIRGFSVS